MDKEWKNPCNVKNNPWVAEIERGKCVGGWSFSVPQKVKIKDFDNLTYEEAKEFLDELINLMMPKSLIIRHGGPNMKFHQS